jgi:hypothetical protein
MLGASRCGVLPACDGFVAAPGLVGTDCQDLYVYDDKTGVEIAILHGCNGQLGCIEGPATLTGLSQDCITGWVNMPPPTACANTTDAGSDDGGGAADAATD